MTSIKRDYLTFTAHQKPTVGDTKISAVGIDHMGWLVCDGRLLNVNEWILLFNAIGYQFGGAGAQFRLPAPAGRVTGIAGAGAGLTARAIGATTGTETHTLTIAEMPAHDHGGVTGDASVDVTQTSVVTNVTANSEATTASAGLSSSYLTGINVTTADPSLTPNPHNHTISSQGGDEPHNNMQPTLFVGNLFMYSGKVNYGNYPYTAGYYAFPSQNTLLSNIQ